MNIKSFKTLEYIKIIEKLSEKAISTMAKKLCLDLLPSTDIEIAKKEQEKTSEALELLLKQSSLPLGGITDISFSTKRALNNGILNIEEIFYIGEFIYVCKKMQKYSSFAINRPSLPIIDEMFSNIISIHSLDKQIPKAIKNQNEIFDDATDRLLTIRRGIKSAGDNINNALNSIIQSTAYKNMIQDSVITIRSDRFCIPIKKGHQNSFPGIIHDMSSSGSTYFIEPSSVVNLNNKIRELKLEEKEEIENILRNLSSEISKYYIELNSNQAILTELDFIFAKAELALEMNAIMPSLNENGIIDIKKARHPLLDSKKVVPIDIELGEEYKCLLITGPNTGGKTVALKTLGLFCLMSASGLFIPASSGAKISIFDSIFSDIGDEQSIEQSLSTFSSHMVNIISILNEISPNSLVLLDELGAGTDPTEGAALAIAIIQNILDWGATSAITTHYSELKIFAIENKKIMNAAVEFDIDTLSPTYKLISGALGKSNAFAISKRLGLQDNIINYAKSILSKENIKFEDIISDLETSKKIAEIEEERISNLRIDSENLKKEIEKQKERIIKAKDKEILKAKNEAKDIISRAKKEADEIIKQMRDSNNFSKLEEGRSKLNKSLSNLSKSEFEPINKKIITKKDLFDGDFVFIHSLGISGTIKKINKNSNIATIIAGSMEIQAKLSDISFQEKEQEETKNKKIQSHSNINANKAANISLSLDLRGKLASEALDILDKYIDDAYLASASKIEIIHGKGTGVLRDAVQKALKKNLYIKKYRLGEFGEGDSGITIAELN